MPVSRVSRTLRQRGPLPTLDDREVLTIEVVGVFLGLSRDKDAFLALQEE